MQELINRIQNRTAKVCVVGLGYVGIPLVIRILECGYNVVGIDTDNKKIDAIKNKQKYINHLDFSSVFTAMDEGRFTAQNHYFGQSADIYLVCVPTPVNRRKDPNLTYLQNSIQDIAKTAQDGCFISIESTSYPGCTDDMDVIIRDQLDDFYLGYSPEREDPGNGVYNTKNIPKIVSGKNQSSLSIAKEFYSTIVDEIVPVADCRTAEMAKILENAYRLVNISFVNELKVLCDKMGIDLLGAIDAAATKPFGFQPFYPGPKTGGHCIYPDPLYLQHAAKNYETVSEFITRAIDVADSMNAFLVSKISDALNYVSKSLNGSKILFMGIAYKKNIDDSRDSAFKSVYLKLQNKGAIVFYHDPYIPVFSKFSSVAPELEDYDCVVILADHDCFDYEAVLNRSKTVVDCRGRIRKISPHVYRA